MKRINKAVTNVIAFVFGTLGGLVMLVGSATIMPLSRAYHMGRLAAERDYQSSTADIMAAMAKALGDLGDKEKVPTDGQYL